MRLGDEELWEEGRTGTPDLAGAPGIIEAIVVAEVAAAPRAPDVSEAPDVPDVLDVAGLRTTPDVPHVPLWGPPSRGGAVASWQQAPPADLDGTGAALEPAPLEPPVGEPRYRRAALVGVTLAGAVLLLGVVAVTGWPSTQGANSVANQFGPGDPGPTDHDRQPAELPPSQPATPVSFAPSGEVVRPEPRRARIVDPRSGEEVVVDLPPGTSVDTATGQVVVRITGTPTSIRTSTTTTRETTSSSTETTTTTTEDTTTTSTVDEPTTTVDPTIPDETLP